MVCSSEQGARRSPYQNRPGGTAPQPWIVVPVTAASPAFRVCVVHRARGAFWGQVGSWVGLPYSREFGFQVFPRRGSAQELKPG